MDEARILSRLRIDHGLKNRNYKREIKKFPFARLKQILRDTSERGFLPTSGEQRELSASVLRDLEILHGKVSRIVRSKEQKGQLHCLVMQTLKLCNSLTVDLDAGAKYVRQFSPNIEDQNVIEKVRKLGWYHKISQELVGASCKSKYTIFNHLKVEIVQIYPTIKSLTSPLPSTFLGSLETALNSIEPSQGRRKNGLISNYVKSPSVVGMLGEKTTEFNQGLSRVPKNWKVHAEIQLLLHYELHPNLPKPRVSFVFIAMRWKMKHTCPHHCKAPPYVSLYTCVRYDQSLRLIIGCLRAVSV